MARWPGARRSALLTFAAAYVVLFADFYLYFYPGGLQAIALMLAIALPAMGAAYGIFFFHWLYESERSVPYADYGFGIWLISSLASLIYMAVFAGLGALLPYGLERLELFGNTVQMVASRMTLASDYFEPVVGRNLALFVLLEVFACAYGKKEGMRLRASRPDAGPERSGP
ncbi:hypothetical protein C5L14_24350 [Labrys okinawensis]|uniref:DUF4199 domain-containing protein n=1 Tax=Labrys okinawensis TaxID=346911 RepID=A0A2S9Q6U4_9HYPH|nr:hypothetical protein [Labrys okinawensis]PRH85071.1 hypothetical protein C5L14_24350 [Labrys okinawensis]